MTTSTITEYAKSRRITAAITADLGVQYADGDWQHHAYRVQLTNGLTGRKMTIPWKQGMAITTLPTAAAVLSALVSDATAWRDSADVLEFAAEFGYELDDARARRKVSAIYTACGKTNTRLTTFLGGPAEFDVLAYETENDQ